MGRERRAFKRPGLNRSQHKVFVIATEGQVTEVQYFEALKSSETETRPRIYVEILEKNCSGSSPKSVIKMLDEFKREYRIVEQDELWMVIDRDKQSWKVREISEVATLCIQKKYQMAMSNPAFELWLLLHRKSLDEYNNEELTELYANKRVSKDRTRLEKELVKVCGSYSKTKFKVEDYLPFVRDAIKHSEALIRVPDERWPDYPGTHVHKLVKNLIK